MLAEGFSIGIFSGGGTGGTESLLGNSLNNEGSKPVVLFGLAVFSGSFGGSCRGSPKGMAFKSRSLSESTTADLTCFLALVYFISQMGAIYILFKLL